MPLFPPLTDTLRWQDLVRQGRAQLPLVAPEWTDQNTSDVGIALLELLSWLVEADGYRAGAVTDRERRLLLALTGHAAAPARPATCLLRLSTAAGGAFLVPPGLVVAGWREGGRVPLTLPDDVALIGATIAVLASADPDAEADDYRTGCVDLTQARAAGLAVHPLGADPAVGSALLIGLEAPGGTGLPAATLDLWAVVQPGLAAPETPAAPGPHHGAATVWEVWDGSGWVEIADSRVQDDTVALTRTGRARLTLPVPAPPSTLGDQAVGALAGRTCSWLRCRLAAGRHDVAPLLAAVHVDVGRAVASQAYATSLEVDSGTPVTGAPTPGVALPHAVVSPVVAPDGTVTAVRFDPPPSLPPAGGASGVVPAVEVVGWAPPVGAAPGRLDADLVVLGTASGVPEEGFELPDPWCGSPPVLWVVEPDGSPVAVLLVPDQAVAGPQDLAAHLDPDGVGVRFGDGRTGRTLTPGATVLASGQWTVPAAVGEIHPPLAVEVPDDARTQALLGPTTVRAELVDGLVSGGAAEDVSQLAARADSALWVHDRLAEAVRRTGGTSLDDLPLEAVRRLGRPERAVTVPDLERISLATPGTCLWRARALPEVDPRLPGLRADGCVTVVVVPSLPVDRPEPTAGLLARCRAELAGTRTLGTRVFVVGPEYVSIGVAARLVLLGGTTPADALATATRAVRAFLHPVSGGPAGRGWRFGRTVRRSELLQLLDASPGVDRVEGLVLTKEPGTGDCGDVAICPTQLVLAGTVALTTVAAGGIS